MKILLICICLIFAFEVKAQTIADPSDSTDHYHIKQWEQGENPGADALNQNSNIIDSAIWNVESQLEVKADAANAVLTGTASIVSSYSAYLTVSASEVDWSLRNNRIKTLTGNTTLSFTNTQDGQILNLIIANPDDYTLSFVGVDFWAGGEEPTAPTSANSIGFYTFTKIGLSIYGALRLF